MNIIWAPFARVTRKGGANLAALHAENAGRDTPIKIRHVKYLNNGDEQDHRAIKRIIRPMLGSKDFRCARVILSGIEIMHMIAKGQIKHWQNQAICSLPVLLVGDVSFPHHTAFVWLNRLTATEPIQVRLRQFALLAGAGFTQLRPVMQRLHHIGKRLRYDRYDRP
jgi:DDE domain